MLTGLVHAGERHVGAKTPRGSGTSGPPATLPGALCLLSGVAANDYFSG